MATRSNVLDRFPAETKGLTKDRTKELVSAGIHRAVLNHGLSSVAGAAECSTRTIENAMAMATLPETHTLGNILRLEPTVLWEWLSELGFKIVPKDMALSPDMQTATEMSQLLTMLLRALDDGRRDHRETAQLAGPCRALILKLSAIVEEADEHRVGKRS